MRGCSGFPCFETFTRLGVRKGNVRLVPQRQADGDDELESFKREDSENAGRKSMLAANDSSVHEEHV